MNTTRHTHRQLVQVMQTFRPSVTLGLLVSAMSFAAATATAPGQMPHQQNVSSQVRESSHVHVSSPEQLVLLAAFAAASQPSAAAPAAAVSAAVWSPPPTLDSVPFPPRERVTEPRLVHPRWALEGWQVKVSVDFPPSAVGGGAQRSATTQPLAVEPTPVARRVVFRVTDPTTQRQADKNDGSDGSVSIGYSVPPGHDRTLTVEAAIDGQVLTGEVRVVNQALARVPDAYRAEVERWIGEDNSVRPIWGRRPTWDNLQRLLKVTISPILPPHLPTAETQPTNTQPAETQPANSNAPATVSLTDRSEPGPASLAATSAPATSMVESTPAAQVFLARDPSDPYRSLTGFMLRSYFNRQINQLQSYTLYVPPTLDQSQAVPLMILLHGSGGDYRNLIADHAAGQRFDEHPMLIANAGAFRFQEYRHLALNDVLGVLEDVTAKYRIDPDRVYLQGMSLGGRGVLDIAALLPDVFAAASSQGSYGLMEDQLDPLSPLNGEPTSRWLSARNDIRTWLPNLQHMPVEFVFGWNDQNTPPMLALMQGACLQQAGGTAVLRGFQRDHNISLPEYDWVTTRQWLLTHRRKADNVTEVTHRVSNLRFGRNRWVQVDALTDYSRVGEVRAKLTQPAGAEEGGHVLDLQTWHIEALTVSPPAALREIRWTDHSDPQRPRQCRITVKPPPTSTSADVPPGSRDAARSARVEWSLSWPSDSAAGGLGDRASTDAHHKRPGASGPLWDIYSEPLMVVHGSDTLSLSSASGTVPWDISRVESDEMRLGAAGPLEPATVVDSRAVQPDGALPPNVIWIVRDPSELPAGVEMPQWSSDPVAHEALAKLAETGWCAWIAPHPIGGTGSAVYVVNRTRQAVLLWQFGWWDIALQSDWVIWSPDQPSEQRRASRSSGGTLRCGVFRHDWSPGAWTEQDPRSSPWLGPKARN